MVSLRISEFECYSESSLVAPLGNVTEDEVEPLILFLLAVVPPELLPPLLLPPVAAAVPPVSLSFIG